MYRKGDPVKDRILVAMSGGVDSSVAAALVKSRGHPVVGVFLRSGHGEDTGRGCCTVEDANDARAVAARLGIPFYILNLQDGFDRLIRHFVQEYVAGRTPSPCVLCNQWLKFGSLLDYARRIGAQSVATGHYARTDREGHRTILRRGRDPRKDQSYFLFSLSEQQISRACFPIGDLTKPEVREIAREYDLPVKEKRESQEVCFVPEEGYDRVIERVAPGSMVPGPMINEEGVEVGRHRGVAGFTIGQRRGLGVAANTPRYVTDIDARTNTVTVGTADDLLRRDFVAGRVNWLIDPPTIGDLVEAAVQIRYRSRPEPARIERIEKEKVRVEFASPVRAIAPGQAAVFYEGDRVLGGGWIESVGG